MSKYVLHIQIVNEELRESYEKAVAQMHTEEYHNNTHKDSGFDLFVPPDDYLMYLGNTQLIDMGIRCAAYKITQQPTIEGYTTRMMQFLIPQAFCIYPRSSIYKTRFRLANNVGIIDSGYRGNLKMAIDTVFNNNDQTSTDIEPLTRLVQICMPSLEPFDVIIVDNLDDTVRGTGCLGSTGK